MKSAINTYATIKEKETLHLKESKERNMGVFGGRNWKGKIKNNMTESNNIYTLRTKETI